MSADWASLDQAARDAAFDNAAAVSDSADRILAWASASTALRAQRPSHLDIPYAPGARTRWDLFPGHASAPCLVFIHGGYWLRNRRETFACMAAGVLAHGWSAALPGYTLAPEATLSQIVAEMRAALDWLAAGGRDRGIGGPVVVAGWSAGGHLATLMLDHPVVTAGLAVSGIFELGPLRDTAYNRMLSLTAAQCEHLSPMRLPIVNKPLALAYGGSELPALAANSRHFHALRRAAGAVGPLQELPGHDHFSILEELRSPGGALTASLLALDLPQG